MTNDLVAHSTVTAALLIANTAAAYWNDDDELPYAWGQMFIPNAATATAGAWQTYATWYKAECFSSAQPGMVAALDFSLLHVAANLLQAAADRGGDGDLDYYRLVTLLKAVSVDTRPLIEIVGISHRRAAEVIRLEYMPERMQAMARTDQGRWYVVAEDGLYRAVAGPVVAAEDDLHSVWPTQAEAEAVAAKLTPGPGVQLQLAGGPLILLQQTDKAAVVAALDRLGYGYDEFGRHPETGEPVGLTEAPIIYDRRTDRLYYDGNYQRRDWYDRAAAGGLVRFDLVQAAEDE